MGAKGLPDNVNHGGGPRLVARLSRKDRSVRRATWFQDRWLVVISAGGISSLEAYRYIYSQLRMATDFKKVLMVFGDGSVGMLTG